MSINYSLYENKLSTAADAYAARVITTDSIGLHEIADRIASMNTTITRPDTLVVLDCIGIVCKDALLDGNRINLGDLIHLFPSIRGVFNDITDTFDPARHRLQVSTAPGKRIRRAIREKATVTKQATIPPEPAPLEFVDHATGTTNHSISPGNIGTIHGKRLKFKPDDTTEGIFFVDCNGTATKAPAVVKNKPGELILSTPALTTSANPYTIEVRARFTVTGELRVGSIDHPLTVLA